MVTNIKPARFSTDVSPGESKTLTRTIDEPATIEEIVVRFYQGPELAVRVYPRRIPDNGNGTPQDLVDYHGKEWIDGDGDKWRFPLSQPVEKNDVIEVEIENTANSDPDVDLTYDVAVHMPLDRHNGAVRAVESLFDRVSGVFG